MDPFNIAVSVIGVYSLVYSVVSRVRDVASSLAFFTKQYGLFAGPLLWGFGSGDVWRIQVQVLKSKDDRVALDFRKSTQDESNIIAVASTIVAQIAITALSLDNLSQTHWVARAFFIFSLVSSIIAVYYASNQYRILGRCLQADQIKAWIRNESDPRKHNLRDVRISSFGNKENEFLPSAASVLTISSPNILLSASLNAFLIGLGVYLGFVWTRNLDASAGPHDSRDVFITYVISLGVCYGIYSLSGVVVAHQIYISESDLIQGEEKTSGGSSTGLGSGQCLGPALGEGAPLGYNGLLPSRIPMQILSKGSAGSISSPMPSAAHSFTKQAGDIQGHMTNLELIIALREAATLRRDTAAADERVAQLYERLSQVQGQ